MSKTYVLFLLMTAIALLAHFGTRRRATEAGRPDA